MSPWVREACWSQREDAIRRAEGFMSRRKWEVRDKLAEARRREALGSCNLRANCVCAQGSEKVRMKEGEKCEAPDEWKQVVKKLWRTWISPQQHSLPPIHEYLAIAHTVASTDTYIHICPLTGPGLWVRLLSPNQTHTHTLYMDSTTKVRHTSAESTNGNIEDHWCVCSILI